MLIETKHTPGPWSWFGNANSNSLYLATNHSGRRYIMDFVRWGMRGAQPRFQPARGGGMIDAKDLLKFEVGDQSITGWDAARKDGSVYRYDVRGISCHDAKVLATSAEVLEAAVNVVNAKNDVMLDLVKAMRDLEAAVIKAVSI